MSMENIIHSFLHTKKLENLSLSTLKAYRADLSRFAIYCKEHDFQMESGITHYLKHLEKTTKYRPNTKSRKLVTFTVDDEGPGIPEGERRRVFERFYRVDAARRRESESGAGLGLAICAWIVGAHGGAIEALGREGPGTRIQVRLPQA